VMDVRIAGVKKGLDGVAAAGDVPTAVCALRLQKEPDTALIRPVAGGDTGQMECVERLAWA